MSDECPETVSEGGRPLGFWTMVIVVDVVSTLTVVVFGCFWFATSPSCFSLFHGVVSKW